MSRKNRRRQFQLQQQQQQAAGRNPASVTAQLLSRVRLLELELSLVPPYEGGLLAHELCGLARGFGFFPVVVGNPWCHPKTGEILALDALFQRVAGHETA